MALQDQILAYPWDLIPYFLSLSLAHRVLQQLTHSFVATVPTCGNALLHGIYLANYLTSFQNLSKYCLLKEDYSNHLIK